MTRQLAWKSITDRNEEKQLRLGLGQVLRYRQLLADREKVIQAVLAIQRERSDGGWLDLCDAVGVQMIWPGAFDRLDLPE